MPNIDAVRKFLHSRFFSGRVRYDLPSAYTSLLARIMADFLRVSAIWALQFGGQVDRRLYGGAEYRSIAFSGRVPVSPHVGDITSFRLSATFQAAYPFLGVGGFATYRSEIHV